LEVFEQVLASLRAVAVIDVQRDVLDVEVYRVAVDEELNHRHEDDDQKTPAVAPDLDRFLARHRQDAPPVHAARP
jgi:hypothetical protein